MACAQPRFVVVGTFSSVAEAEMARGQLAAAGLEVRVDNAQTISVLPMHSLAIGVEVVVPARDAARARDILGFRAEDQDEQTEPGSALVLHENDAWMRRAATAAALGVLLLPVLPTLYAVWLLGRHGRAPMSLRGRRYRTIASVASVLAVIFAAGFVGLIC